MPLLPPTPPRTFRRVAETDPSDAEYHRSSLPVPMARSTSTTRSLLEVLLGFLGALLIVPLLFKTASSLVRGIFRLGTTKRIIGDVVIAGLTALLTREDVLDKIFGRKGQTGDGLLKPPVE